MPTPYSPGAGKVKPDASAFAVEESMGNLDQNPCAIARLRIAPAGAAMGQVDENLNALQNDIVRLLAFDAGDKAHAALIVLVLRVVETLSRWQPSKWINLLHSALFPLKTALKPGLATDATSRQGFF